MSEEKILIAGFGGQGVMMMGQLLAYCGNKLGFNSLWVPSYGPETRGGTANCSIIISDSPIYSPVFQKARAVIIMNQPSLEKFLDRVADGGVLLINTSLVTLLKPMDKVSVCCIPVNDLAFELGNLKVANTIMLGAYLAVSGLFTTDQISEVIADYLKDGKEKFIDINTKALLRGYQYAKENCKC
ncbi:MAG: 2-oxoacid:acceptor oxidoreductase family protein [Bacilli bacterium]|nr:2-oxoacid:acceptor oxidoreductase family protein [Bacilli bacterium]